jgi:hypothetical protein
MTKRERRAKRPAKPRSVLRRALDTSATRVDPNKQQADDVTERLNAIYGAEPEDSAMDPLLTELQIRSLREKW